MLEKKDIEKLASLSRIEVKEEEKGILLKDLESILGYVSEIQEVVIGSVEPKEGKLHNVMREDENPHGSGLFSEDIMNNIPDKKDGYVKVKKIL